MFDISLLEKWLQQCIYHQNRRQRIVFDGLIVAGRTGSWWGRGFRSSSRTGWWWILGISPGVTASPSNTSSVNNMPSEETRGGTCRRGLPSHQGFYIAFPHHHHQNTESYFCDYHLKAGKKFSFAAARWPGGMQAVTRTVIKRWNGLETSTGTCCCKRTTNNCVSVCAPVPLVPVMASWLSSRRHCVVSFPEIYFNATIHVVTWSSLHLGMSHLRLCSTTVAVTFPLPCICSLFVLLLPPPPPLAFTHVHNIWGLKRFSFVNLRSTGFWTSFALLY